MRRLRCVGTVFPALGLVLAHGPGQPPAAQSPTFTDVTTVRLADPNGNGRGGAWGDYNNDGRIDLYLTNWGSINRLFRNDGGDSFTDVTPVNADNPRPEDINNDDLVSGADLGILLGEWGQTSSPADINEDGIVNGADLAMVLGEWDDIQMAYIPVANLGTSLGGRAVWGDYDNNGTLDLYLVNGGSNKLYRNDGPGAFVDVTSAVTEIGTLSRGVTWIDVDNDGLLDLYVTNSGPNRLLRNLGGDAFENITAPPLDDAGIGRGVAWCDYDNDGDQDLYLANGAPGGSLAEAVNRLFRNDGGGAFTDVTISAGVDHVGHSRGVAWGDFDNDGDFDLYVTNLRVEGMEDEDRLYRNEGNGTFTDVTASSGVAEHLQTRDCAWVDYDNDGWVDLYVVHAFAANALHRNNGDGTFTQVGAGSVLDHDVDSNGASWADYDGDGDLDVFLTNRDGGNLLLRNDLSVGAPNAHWVEFRLTGTVSNRSAIGARITVEAGGMVQMREVHSGSGYLSQHMLTAHFGLGIAGVADQVVITWPSGIVQVLENVAADAIYDVTEPTE